MKHTQGPWRLKDHGAIYGPGNEYIADLGISSRYENAPANAQLIAAAPDLLKACEEALNGLEYVRDAHPNTTGILQRNEAIRLLYVAIAKAKGEILAPKVRFDGAQPS